MEAKLNEHDFLEIETKYSADLIGRMDFKKLVSSFDPISFLYVESKDVYYVKSDTEFLRHRNPPDFNGEKRAELTFKKKHTVKNNNTRTEVNLRIDSNSPETVGAFCEGLGYKKNFSIMKFCDIYFFQDGANVVYYSVIDEDGKCSNFIEIEAGEGLGLTSEQSWEIVLKYEKMLLPLGITAQKRKKLSLFEMYRKNI